MLMSRVKSQPYHLRSMTYMSTMIQTLSPPSSSPLAISVKKGEKILRGSLHSVRGSIGSDIETLVYWLLVYLGLFFASITVVFNVFCLKLQYNLLLNVSIYTQYVCV